MGKKGMREGRKDGGKGRKGRRRERRRKTSGGREGSLGVTGEGTGTPVRGGEGVTWLGGPG